MTKMPMSTVLNVDATPIRRKYGLFTALAEASAAVMNASMVCQFVASTECVFSNLGGVGRTPSRRYSRSHRETLAHY
jgi:hypothetical protein